MSLTIKPGTRLFSAVCETEMIAVKAPADAIEITIGGAPALTEAADAERQRRRRSRRRHVDRQALRR